MTRRFQILSLIAVMVMLYAAVLSEGQITPSQDAYTNTANPTTNFGSLAGLDVQSGSQTTYIQFDLSPVPTGYTSVNLTKATLKLYVNAVTAAGSFNIDFVTSPWAELTITANSAPSLGAAIASNVSLPKAAVHDYILVDITPAVAAWLDGTQANNGIALVASSPLNASFDSKENTTNSHAAELDLVLAGKGTGTITGVTTANGTGLTGGGTLGSLSLGLSTACASGQVLQSNGSGWNCSSAGSGTVTSVNTLAGSGLTGGPISSSGNLSIAPAGVSNAMLANPSFTINAGTGLAGNSPGLPLGGSITMAVDAAKVPELSTNNTFSGNQTFAGNVGVGTTTPGAQLDVFSSSVGVHTPMARFGSAGTGDSNDVQLYNGTGVTEMFQAGFPNAFVAGTQAGDGGLRVIPGKSIFFGDNLGGQRMVINGTGDVIVNSAAPTVIGNTGCGAGYGGIGFGATSLTSCQNYSLLGDGTNTYFNRPVNGQVVFREGNATEMALVSGGNLGIGTAMPGYLLHVNGVARAEAGISLGGNATLAVDAPGTIGGHFLLQPNGTIGINDTNSHFSLDVAGTFSLNGDFPMTANPRMTFSGYVNGSFCDPGQVFCGFAFAGGSVGVFVPDKSINITRMSVALASLVDSSCSPQPQITLGPQFGPANYSLLIPPSAKFVDSGVAAINLAVSAGTPIYLNYTADDCTGGLASSGADAWVNVQYEMQ